LPSRSMGKVHPAQSRGRRGRVQSRQRPDRRVPHGVSRDHRRAAHLHENLNAVRTPLIPIPKSSPHLPGADWTLTPRGTFPVDRPPLEGGTITIRGERIAAVLPRGRRKADADAGNVAILPGLVNAHTHLDLSDLHGKVRPGQDFIAWLRQVVAYRRTQTAK